MTNIYLTKSLFQLGSECSRKLFYEAHADRYANQRSEDEFLAALAEGGHQVGALARCGFPRGVTVATPDTDEAVAQTEALLDRDEVVIFEAAIRHGSFLVRADILVKRGAVLEIIEVKAKSCDPHEPNFWGKRHPDIIRKQWLSYLDDVAFQTWVLRQAHPDWEVLPRLMTVNRDQPATAEGLHQLFRIRRSGGNVEVELTDTPTATRLGRTILAAVDVSREVNAIIEGNGRDPVADPINAKPLRDRATHLESLRSGERRLPVELGRKCKDCEYRTDGQFASDGKRSGYRECWQEKLGKDFDPHSPHIFDIWNARKLDEWIEQGIYRMERVPNSDLNDRQALQVDVAVGRRPETEVVHPHLIKEMEGWEYPLHFVDFETITPAIPFHSGLRPYQTIAFQFSCHHVHSDGTITHDQWLSKDPGTYPNHQFLIQLRRSLGDTGTILRYASHENTVLKHLGNQIRESVRPAPPTPDFLDMLKWIDTLIDDGHRSMVDMCALVKSGYYHRRMGGSNSIKSVLPAVLESSNFLRAIYSDPLDYGTNLRGMAMWQYDSPTGNVRDPYSLLPPLLSECDLEQLKFLDVDEKVKDGGGAMMAWARMQFCEMPEAERRALAEGLLRYCELDTLAMVMIYQHWRHRTT